MKTAPTVADPTLILNEDDSGRQGRAVLLVYGSADQHSKIIELPDLSQVVFGRSRKSTVHVDSDGVSRSHAELSRTGDEFSIRDLGSANGTVVNGKLITEATTLQSGDEISVGPITAVLSVMSSLRVRSKLGSTTFLSDRLAAECDRAQRYRRPLAVVIMRLEGSNSVIDECIERLVNMMRAMDSACEYSPDEIALVLPELDVNDAKKITQRLGEQARKILGASPSALRIGLAVYPTHGTHPEELIGSAHSALRNAQATSTLVATPASDRTQGAAIVCAPQMQRVYHLVEKVAASTITVLIHGETGVGKEMVAAAVHDNSPRKAKPYVRLNCASIPETLLESELFGHEKGSFTGADRRKEGYFEAACGGTIFLDEIGEISAAVQAKLLRVLENRSITRVGGTVEIPVDVRVVCATNRDLETEITEGRFREDLYYRISAFSIVVPPLRDRRQDIVPLCKHFLHASSAGDTLVLAADASRALEIYEWPGNVRQLRNAMERAVVLASDGVVTVADLPDRVRTAVGSSRADSSTKTAPSDMRDQLADVEKAAIIDALEKASGNQTKAAKQLGLSRRALIYKMEKHGLKEPPASRR